MIHAGVSRLNRPSRVARPSEILPDSIGYRLADTTSAAFNNWARSILPRRFVRVRAINLPGGVSLTKGAGVYCTILSVIDVSSSSSAGDSSSEGSPGSDSGSGVASGSGSPVGSGSGVGSGSSCSGVVASSPANSTSALRASLRSFR